MDANEKIETAGNEYYELDIFRKVKVNESVGLEYQFPRQIREMGNRYAVGKEFKITNKVRLIQKS